MLRSLLLGLILLPSLVWAEATLVERAAQIRATRTAPEPPIWCTNDESVPEIYRNTGIVRYMPSLWEFNPKSDVLPEMIDVRGNARKYESALGWFLLTEDFEAVRMLATHAQPGELALGEIALATLEFERADSLFRVALATPDPTIQRLCKIGLAKALQKRQEYQAALDLLATAWTPEQLSDDVIFQAALCKQELGETSESMDLLEEVLRWNTYHELGHYYLGNGYARKNYSELEGLSPHMKCDSGKVCARALVVDGSAEWMHGEYESALEHFMAALALVPEYGRAHNGVAKCLEQLRMRENLYRAADQAKFDAKPTPQIPLIEQYVLNWETLSERHKKQVALSVEPWQAYLPVLVASGSHHYIKPLHEKLSEVPGLETIADQRISYDSRLWDDVRGCGGYTTVTGIEDVERSIYNRYNTVLHELTHQVHGVFPPEDQQRIEDLYHEASATDAAGTEIFVSRYQGSSVWEYFAEGVNSYFSPRRNAYDTREITKERLLRLDPKLVALLEYYMTGPNIEACYPVGLITAADNDVELGKLESAMGYARQAEQKESGSEVVLRAISRIACYADQDNVAQNYALRLLAGYPTKAASYAQVAWSKFFTDGDFVAVLPDYEAGVSHTTGSEQVQARKNLADWQVACGKFAEAVVNYRLVLAVQETDDAALRGYAEALVWLGELALADSVYGVAIQRRSGVASLRLDYARALLGKQRLAEAEKQISEAGLLKPGDGRVAIHRAWLKQAEGDSQAARSDAMSALKQYPDDALVQAIAANILAPAAKQALIADAARAIPRWVYHVSEATFEARSYWDAPTRMILEHGLTIPSK